MFVARVGDVISAAIVTDWDTGHSQGFGFVEMTSLENAEPAVADLDGRELDGRSLKVELAKPKVRSYAN
jgi:RNA recognition motif-containing protein